MTLVSDDLLTPDGEVDGALFYPALSSVEVGIRLASYITQGYELAAAIVDSATQDRVARFYAYYRAWSDVVNMLTLTPASVSLAGEVSSSRLQSQINAWIEKRDEWRDAFQGLIPGSLTRVDPRTTQNVPLRTYW